MDGMILISIILAIGFIIFWVIMIMISSDVRIEVEEEGKSKAKVFKGKIILNESTKKIRIKNKSNDTIPYWQEYFIEGEKKPILRIFKSRNGEYFPIRRGISEHMPSEIQEQVDFKDMTFWHTLETREGDEKYKKNQFLEFLNQEMASIFQ